jgi:hypothetical protein
MVMVDWVVSDVYLTETGHLLDDNFENFQQESEG